MLAEFARHWWVFAVRGLAAVVFGILAFVWPGLTVGVLILFFGVFVFADGLLTVIGAIRTRAQNDRWWAYLLEGLAGVAIGVLTFTWPQVTGLILLYFIAIWALATGLMEILAAIRLRKEIEGEWALIVSGLASVIFGLILAFRPGAGALGIVWLIGGYAILFGLLLFAVAFRLKSLQGRAGAQPAAG
jgi:uncharacterized membrane protein HdeD (DUF308 family)